MKYHIWTEGCQMNAADSRHMAAALETMDYEATSHPDDADVIILNTCVVRQSAEDKAYGRLQSLKPLKKNHPDLVINLMGCLVGVKNTDRLRQRFPFVDVFSPPSDPRPLLEYLAHKDGRVIDSQATAQRFFLQDEELQLPAAERGRLVSAHLPVVLGCSHACTYCVIPYRRGVERSRAPQEILSEARSLAQQGVKELTLLGQIVDRYGKDEPSYPDLPRLLGRLHEISGIERLRFLTSHPNWITDDLLRAVADYPKVMTHIEVPVQAGDDEVLRNMRRGYTASQYRELVGRIREMITGVSIATDIIVGFPGETEGQFQHTYDLLAELRLDVAHLARYSPRPDTVATRRMVDDVPSDEKWRRFRLLEELQEGIAGEIHAQLLGRTVKVLFEERVKQRWRGRTPTNKLVFVETDEDLRGRVEEVIVSWTGPWSMIGELTKERMNRG